jgi:hypothetical protein
MQLSWPVSHNIYFYDILLPSIKQRSLHDLTLVGICERILVPFNFRAGYLPAIGYQLPSKLGQKQGGVSGDGRNPSVHHASTRVRLISGMLRRRKWCSRCGSFARHHSIAYFLRIFIPMGDYPTIISPQINHVCVGSSATNERGL